MAKAPKMMMCRHCGAMIAVKASVCPFCGIKNKKPLYRRAGFWILIILLVLIIAGAASCSGESSSPQKVGTVGSSGSAPAGSSEKAASSADTAVSAASAGTNAASSAEDADVPALQDVYHVGDVLQDGDVRIVYAASGVYEGNEYAPPEEGEQIIFLKLAFENMSETSDTSISFYSFEAYADGYAADMYYGGDEDLSATLSAGRKTMGFLYFTVPADAEEIEIEYTSNFWTEEKITFAYDGVTDSGYELEKDTAAAADAHTVGETAELPKLKITCLSCEAYTSDNIFVTPAPGRHYTRCTFEFENTGDDDQIVTSYDFDCYADGIACGQIFLADDDLSATLSPGRKAKGSVIFEIPDDAVTVEAEYLNNIWTSERAVFTVQ